MKLLRSPSTGAKWSKTDERSPRAYLEDWELGDAIRFDGTVEKFGSRHTHIGVVLDERDILALHDALVKHYRKRERRVNDLIKRVEELESTIRKVGQLASPWSPAPSTPLALEAIKEVADHYGDCDNCDTRFRSSYRWVKWNEL